MKLRLRYSKLGKIRFVSHRDMARIWERVLRKANFPMAYSEGFHPRPKISFGLALPTCGESDCEYLDITAAPEWDATEIDGLPERFTAAMPDGIIVEDVVELPTGMDSLQAAVTSCTWNIEIINTTEIDAADYVARVLAAEVLEVTRVRKGKPVTDDIRPLIYSLALTQTADGNLALAAELGTQPRALRPSEVVLAVEPHLETGRIRRTKQWITVDGARCEPLAAVAAVDDHTTVGVG